MKVRTNVDVLREMNLGDGLRTLVAQPAAAGPTLYVELTMPTEIQAIPPLVHRIMYLIRMSHCVPGDHEDIEIALREALANAVLHGNRLDVTKKVHIRCRVRPGKEVSIEVKDEGSGFDPTRVPNPTASENILATGGRGIYLMKVFMDLVHFDLGGTRVRLQKGFKRSPVRCSTKAENAGGGEAK
jgi:serine/threonine-protein kinase RsbW